MEGRKPRIQEIKKIQGTNDSSTISKCSMIKQGYFEDDFARLFARRYSRRSPLINRGYYIRSKAVSWAFQQFFNGVKPATSCQILSLGAGFDSSFFRMKNSGQFPTSVIYFEVDYFDVMKQKVSIIKNCNELNCLLGPTCQPSGGCSNIYCVLNTSDYKLFGIDLNDLKSLGLALLECGVDMNLPTFVVSECAITYMDAKGSDALISWIGEFFMNPLFAIYEQILPHDGFGNIMTDHFRSVGSPLLSIHTYQDVAAIKQRFMTRGWHDCNVITMNEYYHTYLSVEERQRINTLEPFDEFEEFHLKCSHYVLILASKYNRMVGIMSIPITPKKVAVKKNLVLHPLLLDGVKRFGHASVLLANKLVITVGGFGEEKGKHFRLKTGCITDFTTRKETLVEITGQITCGIMHHSLNFLQDSSIVLFGGRESPLKPNHDVHLLRFSGCSLNSDHHAAEECIAHSVHHGSPNLLENPIISIETLTTTGDIPPPRWRHSSSLIMIENKEFLIIHGGITVNQVMYDDFYGLNIQTRHWSKIVVSGYNVGARHSHTMCAWGDHLIVVSGGLSSQQQPLSSICTLDCITHKASLLVEDIIFPRYSHTAHIWKEKLILIGGVNTYSDMPPGIAIIDLTTRLSYEVSFHVLERPLLLHNHTSVLSEDTDMVIIFGGGGNCFSFGTHFNENAISIYISDIIESER